MAKTAADYSQSIRAQLKVLDPDISADPLTPERKIIDTVAETLADASIDSFVLNYQFDINTKVGSDLDKFVSLFGFGRQAGRRSTGFITFGRNTTSTVDTFIAAGTQVLKPATSVSPVVVFLTTASVVLGAGDTEVIAPIQSVDIGVQGNVPAGTITLLGSGTSGLISTVTNNDGTSGGTNPESDAELRLRFKNTIFRNVAGTQDQFLALALSSQSVSKAIVIGPQSRYFEWVQVPLGSTIISGINYSQYTYNQDYYLTDGNPTIETFYTPNGVDYTFTNTVPPTVTINSSATTLTGTTTLPTATVTVSSTTGFPSAGIAHISGQTITYTGKTSSTLTGVTGGLGTFPAGTAVTYGNLQVGAVGLLEHTYCSINSRNNPVSNIMNNVDVYIAGQDDTNATDVVHFPTTIFSSTSSSPYYTGKFKRLLTGATPVVGNYYLPLLWQPVASLPSSITVNGASFYQGSDYWLVSDSTVYRGSRRSKDGIEWTAAAAATIGAGSEFTVNYIFDRLPMTLNELMEAHKQITTDVLVHSAVERYFNVNVIVMYTPGYTKTNVDSAIATAVENFFGLKNFGDSIQISDLLEAIHSVPGVDNIRLARSADGIAYGIQEVAVDGLTPINVPYTSDFSLMDSDLPVLNNIVLSQRTQNTW